ncbi:N-carbamoylsarcosine amidase [compost metagenome]
MKVFRANHFPIVHVTTCYQNTDRQDPNTDMGQWHNKIPVDVVDQADENLWAIDSRIAPIDGEFVLIKKRASSFSGTSLAGYLRSAGVDTILVTGVTASACVRTTLCDGLAEGFRTIAVKECIGDRVPGAVAWNLFDIDAKFADVETVDSCLDYLTSIGKQ